jgi:hypothetical protein
MCTGKIICIGKGITEAKVNQAALRLSHIYLCMYMCVCVCVYIYIYIYSQPATNSVPSYTNQAALRLAVQFAPWKVKTLDLEDTFCIIQV